MTVACAIVGDSIALAVDLAVATRCAVVAKGGIGTRAFADLYANPLAAGLTAISLGANDGASADAAALRSLRAKIDGTVVWLLPANSAAAREAVALVASESLAKVGRCRDVGDIFPRLSCDKCRQKPVRLIGVCASSHPSRSARISRFSHRSRRQRPHERR